MNKVNLGDKVKDTVTGFTGIAVGRTVWLHGCARIIIQPEGVTKDGKLFDNFSFDEPQVVVIKAAKTKEGSHKTGGPKPEVAQKQHQTR